MSNSKVREEFEVWVISNWPNQSLDRFNPLHGVTEGEYTGFTVQHCWEAWQASREALVIDLPQIVAYEAGYDSIRENEYASQSGELFDADEVFALHRSIEVLEAIEAAGVKVKS